MRAIGLTMAMLGGAAACSPSEDPCELPGTACVWAGVGERGYNVENEDAHRLDSKLYFPEDLTFDAEDRAYVVDWNNHRIRRVDASGSMITVIGTDYEGDGPPEMEDRLPYCAPAGAPGTTVAMNHMTDVEFGPDGKLYVAAWHNNKIRIYDPVTELVTAYGNGYGYAGDDQAACSALFNQPKAVVIGDDGTIYTIDQRNVRIRAITPDGMIRTIAGVGTVGAAGDGGPARDAQFGFEIGTTPRPSGALVLSDRTLYVADSLNNRIRRINLDTGVIDCIAGTGEPGYSGDGGQALEATFNYPMDMELGPDGRLYVADRYNHVIRAIDVGTGLVETVAGSGTQCEIDRTTCPSMVGALELQLNEPYGVAFDHKGAMYVADTHNHNIVKITP